MKYLAICGFILSAGFVVPQLYADQVLSDKARHLYNCAEFTEAINSYRNILKDEPGNVEAYLNLAYLYKDLADYKQAVGILKEALNFSGDARLKALLGRLYYLSGNPGEGAVYLRQLLSSAPMNPKVLLYLGLCYEDLGKLDEAEDCYLKVIKMQPRNALAYQRLGNIYYQMKLFAKAAETFQKVVSLDPSIVHIRMKIAESLEKTGNFEEAYRQYARSLAVYPQDKLLRDKIEGVKTRLGEEFFKREQKAASKRRSKISPRVSPSPFAGVALQVRVGIVDISDRVEFKCGEDFEVIDKQVGKTFFEGQKESIYSLAFNRGKAIIELKDTSGKVLSVFRKSFLIKHKRRQGKSKNPVISLFNNAVGRGNFWAGWQDQHFRGTIEVIPRQDGFLLVNLVNLEEYLYGVLPAEMPADWPEQALRAQAIAARTWAIKNLARHADKGFDFCNSVHCQVYRGVGAEAPRTNQAVDDTAGLVIVSDEQPIEIFYSADCGGYTRDGVFDGISTDFRFPLSPLQLEDWLSGYPDTFCNLGGEKSANFRWSRLYGQSELQEMLGRAGIKLGEIFRIVPQWREESGHLASIKIEGKKGVEIVEGENNIRKILGNLRSSAFICEVKYNRYSRPEEFFFYGAGFGHGRGLCQDGIKGMALEGYNYPEILRHYYPGTEIKKIY